MKDSLAGLIVCLSLASCGGDSSPTTPTPSSTTTSLVPTQQNRNIAGSYSLTFTAASICTELPSEFRTRTYTATITQRESTLDDVTTTTLSGANFWEHPTLGRLNSFAGTVDGDAVTFQISRHDTAAFANSDRNDLWGIVEQIGPTTLFEIIGTASGSVTDSSISGTLDAGWGFGEDLRDDARHVSCRASNHQFILTRQ